MPVDPKSKWIAIIDDDEAMQDSLRDLMEAAGLEANSYGSAEDFLKSDLHRKAACLIVDVRMPKMSGLELQARLKQEKCKVPIIFITAHDDAETRTQAIEEGAVEFLAKPFDHQLLLKLLRGTLDSGTYGVGSPRFAIAS
jgi:FixJ family two-component response regulator